MKLSTGDVDRVGRVAYGPTPLAVGEAGRLRCLAAVRLARERERACLCRSGVLDALAARERELAAQAQRRGERERRTLMDRAGLLVMRSAADLRTTLQVSRGAARSPWDRETLEIARDLAAALGGATKVKIIETELRMLARREGAA